ncbi:hypothetical protein HDU78_007700 [Chytriomyces hyalinus]|nr:hypothetical protein HDU78_007700 [Chytriomyces hyalinus]
MINAVQWDTLAPLSDAQSECIQQLEQWSRHTPIVTKKDSQRPLSTEDHEQAVKAVSNTADFLSWFSVLESSMEQDHQLAYSAHLGSLNARLQHCDSLIATVDAIDALISQQKMSFDFVEARTEALKRECENLLKEQQALETLSQDVEDRLIKFNVLEPAVRLFNGTGVDGVVMDNEFIPMLARLDDSLLFVESHKSYKDADLYRIKFRQCITRGLSLIKMHFVTSMRALGDDIARVLGERENPAAAPPQSLQAALLYAKFKTAADEASLRGLVAEIEARIPSHTEYYGLLGECLHAFFTVRKSLISSTVNNAMEAICQENADMLQVAKNGAAYIMSLSTDECGLFNHFFSLGEPELIQYLDELSVSLYDHLRPRIVREQRIDVLADLCRSLCLHLESVDSLTSGQAPSAPENTQSPTGTVMSRTGDHASGGAPVKYVVGKILEDAQERLAFRAAEYIRQEIEKFSPKDRELDVFSRSKKLPIPNAMMTQANMVPDLVQSMDTEQVPAQVLQGDSLVQEPRGDSFDHAAADSPASLPKSSSQTSLKDEQLQRAISAGKLVYGSGEWYPTLHKALYILGKLYRAVPRTIFEDLAQEAIDLCRKSMISAADVIGAKSTKLDGQFFLIKNLLMLREQIAPFDSSFVRREDMIDFSAISDALTTIFQNKWGLTQLPTLGLSFLTTQLPSMLVPRLMENVSKDSKLSVNLSLKQTCEDMILDTVKVCVEPVSSFMIKVTAFRLKGMKAGGAASGEKLGMQAFASPQKCVQVSSAFAQSVQAKVGAVVAKMGDYLGDKRTEAVLLLHIKGNIIESYSSFYSVVVGEHPLVVLDGLLNVEDISSLIDMCCAQSMRLS